MTQNDHRTLILIVEDDPASLEIATVALEGAGYDAVGAESAELARESIARQKPDLILMDIALPGMDGLEFTKELKSDQLTAVIPIVALTAHGMPLYERSARSAGCIGFITKPVSPGALVTQVRSFLAVSAKAAG